MTNATRIYIIVSLSYLTCFNYYIPWTIKPNLKAKPPMAFANLNKMDSEHLSAQLSKEIDPNKAMEDQIYSLTDALKNAQIQIEQLTSENQQKSLELETRQIEVNNSFVKAQEELFRIKAITEITNNKVEELFSYLKTIQFEGIMEYGSLKDLELAGINHYDYFMQKISRLNYDLRSKQKTIDTLQNAFDEYLEKATLKEMGPETITLKSIQGTLSLINCTYFQIYQYVASLPWPNMKFYHKKQINSACLILSDFFHSLSPYLTPLNIVYYILEITQSVYYKYFHYNLHKFYQLVTNQWIINYSHMLYFISKMNSDLDHFTISYIHDQDFLASFPKNLSDKFIFLSLFILVTYFLFKLIPKLMLKSLKFTAFLIKQAFHCLFSKRTSTSDTQHSTHKEKSSQRYFDQPNHKIYYSKNMKSTNTDGPKFQDIINLKSNTTNAKINQLTPY